MLGRDSVGRTETHELICEDWLCWDEGELPAKRHRPSALSYAEHDPLIAKKTLFSRRPSNIFLCGAWQSALIPSGDQEGGSYARALTKRQKSSRALKISSCVPLSRWLETNLRLGIEKSVERLCTNVGADVIWEQASSYSSKRSVHS